MIILLIKRLLILFILISASWFGLKFYAESEITEKLNKFVLLASSQAIIRFEATTVHVTGKISLSNVEITPINISEDPFYAERVSVIFPDTFEMIKLMYNVDMGNDFELPKSLRFQFDGINDPLMDIQGIYADAIDDLNNLLREQLSHISDPVCGEDYIIGPKEFSEMGFNHLITGFFWEYNYTPGNQKPGLNFGVNA
ncbi:hypothetical protein, partial [Endozoicomonas sp.]|uniref:hypothetical protein n=1 Tax=Endozoicomonas sp. TaxID=1892382 RepID=UPI00383A9FA4